MQKNLIPENCKDCTLRIYCVPFLVLSFISVTPSVHRHNQHPHYNHQYFAHHGLSRNKFARPVPSFRYEVSSVFLLVVLALWQGDDDETPLHIYTRNLSLLASFYFSVDKILHLICLGECHISWIHALILGEISKYNQWKDSVKTSISDLANKIYDHAFMWIIQGMYHVDVKSLWFFCLFDFSSACVFKCLLKLFTRIMKNYTSYICVFSKATSKCLHKRMQIHISCICVLNDW